MHSSVKCILFSELRCLEVICLSDGKRLGYISDLEIEGDCGRITALILPGPGKFKGMLARGQYRVPYHEIAGIGHDLILVKCYEQIGCERNDRKNN